MKVKVPTLIKRYGPFREIGRAEERRLLSEGKWRHLLAVCDYDESELDEDDDRLLYAYVGHHLVNVQLILYSDKEMPEDLVVDDFYFTEGLMKDEAEGYDNGP